MDLKHAKILVESACSILPAGLWEWTRSNSIFQFDQMILGMLQFYDKNTIFTYEELDRILHPEDRNHVKTLLNKVISGELDKFDCEHRIITRSGAYRWVLNIAQGFNHNEDHVPETVCGMFIDKSREKEKSNQNRMLITELAEKNKILSHLEQILSICSICKKVKLPEQNWEKLEDFFRKNFKFSFSHGLCDECSKNYYPLLVEEASDSSNEQVVEFDPNSFIINYDSSDLIFNNSFDIQSIADSPYTTVVLDFSKIDYIDSSGISNLILLHEYLRKKSKFLSLKNVSQNVIRIFQTLHLGALLKKSEEDETTFYERCKSAE